MHLAVGRAIAPVGDHRRTGLESPDSRGRGHSKTLTATSSLPATTRVAHHLAERARAAKLTARAISAGVIAALGILAPQAILKQRCGCRERPNGCGKRSA